MITTTNESIAHFSRIVQEGSDIKGFEIRLDREFNYIPGQYVMIAFPDDPENYHSFSIVEYDPFINTLKIVVKIKGFFTQKLSSKNEGDELLIKGPYGRFYIKEGDRDIVLIAGGVGITPIYSILSGLARKEYVHHVHFFYSGRNPDQMPLLDKLSYIKNPKMTANYYITDMQKEGFNNKMLNVDDITSKVPNIKDCIVFICGPPPMMDLFRAKLSGMGVPIENVRTETFS